MSRILRYATLAALATMLLGVLAPAAGAATNVTIASVTPSGSSLLVSGSSAYDDAPFSTIGTDPTGDTFTPGFGSIGGDMTEALISTKANGDLQFRWVVSEMLPSPADGAPTGVVHAWNFCVNGDTCFEIDGGRNGLSAGVVGPYAALWSCASPACSPGDQSFVGDGYTAAMSAETKSFTVTLPAGTIGVSPGATVGGASGWSAEGPVYTDLSDGGLFPLFDIGDGVASVDDYSVPGKQVSLAIAAPGLDPATVSYSLTTAPAANGSFNAALSAEGLAAGDYEVYARACFGEGNCGFTSTPVTLT